MIKTNWRGHRFRVVFLSTLQIIVAEMRYFFSTWLIPNNKGRKKVWKASRVIHENTDVVRSRKRFKNPEDEEDKDKVGRFFIFMAGHEDTGGFSAALPCRVPSLLRVGHQLADALAGTDSPLVSRPQSEQRAWKVPQGGEGRYTLSGAEMAASFSSFPPPWRGISCHDRCPGMHLICALKVVC